MTDPIPSLPSDPVTGVADAVAESAAVALKVLTDKNTAEMKKAAEAQKEQAAEDAENKAIQQENLDELRKDSAE